MNNRPVSFIIPCYNCEKTLLESVNSILSCGLEDFEICMVDDGSTDATPKLLAELLKTHPQRIKIDKNEKNMGGAYTRNKCVSISKNGIIFCLDSDNILDKQSVVKSLDLIDEKDEVVAFGNIDFFLDFHGIKLKYKKWEFLKNHMDFNDFRTTLSNPVGSGNYFFTKKVFNEVGGYETDVGALDAYSLGYKILLRGYAFRLIPDSTYFHRLHPNSYWLRETKNNTDNLRKLLLRYPDRFTAQEIESIKISDKITETLIIGKDSFTREEVNSIFAVAAGILKLLKVNTI